MRLDGPALEAAKQLLARRKARDDLNAWARLLGFEPAAHHRVITQALMDLESGNGPRKVMLFLPPGSAKSTYGSMLFPPWFLARNPEASVIASAHTLELAERWGRRVRNIITDHSMDLGIEIAAGNGAAGRWALAADDQLKAGEYLAAGVDKAIAGFRADLGLIDDPVKSRADVMSDTQRDKVWDWYVYDYRTRLKPNAKQVLIMTRWHEDDLAGRILAEERNEWRVITIPMIAEDLNDPLGREIGHRLWPEWFTDEMVAVAQRDPELWNSLYQQRPSAAEGTYWRKEWLHPVSPGQVPPKNQLRIYGASDYAVKAGQGDYTVHMVVGIDPSDRPWLLDIWRERTASDVWVDAWCELVRWYKPMQWAEEQGQIIAGVGPFLERRQREKQAWTDRVPFVSRLDKGQRAQSMRGYIATQGLWYPTDLPYRGDFEAELLAFPAGKHDDMHDALGLVGQLLDMALVGMEPKKPDTKKQSGYKSVNDRGSNVVSIHTL